MEKTNIPIMNVIGCQFMSTLLVSEGLDTA